VTGGNALINHQHAAAARIVVAQAMPFTLDPPAVSDMKVAHAPLRALEVFSALG
jgi:hypothetical protein